MAPAPTDGRLIERHLAITINLPSKGSHAWTNPVAEQRPRINLLKKCRIRRWREELDRTREA